MRMLSTQQSARPPLSMLSSSVMGLGMSVDTAYAFLKTTKTVSYTSARVSKRVCLAAYSTPYFVPDTMGYRPLPLQIKLCVSGRWRFDWLWRLCHRDGKVPEVEHEAGLLVDVVVDPAHPLQYQLAHIVYRELGVPSAIAVG